MLSLLTTLRNPPLTMGTTDVEISVVNRSDFQPLSFVRHILASAPAFDGLVLDGSVGARGWYSDLLAAGFLTRRHDCPPIVIADCTWKRGNGWIDRSACRAGIRFVDDPRITYCVLSTREKEIFPRTWKVESRRVRFTPWPYTIDESELSRPISNTGGVFSGGDSLRDYRSLLQICGALPTPVTVATRLQPPRGFSPPGNLTLGPVAHDRFMECMRRATVVVVPIQGGLERSAGQQTYLNAMALGKPVVVTDALGVTDYVEDGRTGLIVPPGDAAALRRALEWVLDEANREAVQTMGERAKDAARKRFTPKRYANSLLEIVKSAVDHR